MSSIDFDPAIKLCLKFLHSSSSDSTEQLRLTLDDTIRQTYGNSKTLGNVLPKKYLNEEKMESPSRSKHKGDKAGSSKTIAIPQPSPQQIQIPERENDDSVMDGDLAFDFLQEDLTCVVCRQIAVQAGNRLVECDACHALYHQDCHKPIISDEDMTSGWSCASCLTSQSFTASYSAKSSPASKSPTRVSGSTTPVKISSGSSPPSKVVTPNINIISADKRIQIMKKKAAKQHEKKKSK